MRSKYQQNMVIGGHVMQGEDIVVFLYTWKSCGNIGLLACVLTAFLVLPNYHSYFYTLIETRDMFSISQTALHMVSHLFTCVWKITRSLLPNVHTNNISDPVVRRSQNWETLNKPYIVLSCVTLLKRWM